MISSVMPRTYLFSYARQECVRSTSVGYLSVLEEVVIGPGKRAIVPLHQSAKKYTVTGEALSSMIAKSFGYWETYSPCYCEDISAVQVVTVRYFVT